MNRPRILVVDDNAGQRRAVERVLESAYDVDTACNGQEALTKAQPCAFDIALVDIRMPGMDGLELLSHLKANDRDLDVILMTGSASDGDSRLVRAVRGGAFYFVQKPFHRDVLLALVQRCMDLRRLRESEHAHTNQLATELDAARRFQQHMLPAMSAAYPGVELAAIYEPSLELCGDFFEYEGIQRGMALLVADVAGKGAGAAMLTGMVKQAFRSSEREAFQPAVVLQRAFDGCKIFTGERHLTACAARIRFTGNRLEVLGTYGHPPAYRITPRGELTELPPTADTLHPAFDNWGFEQKTFEFNAGDCLIVFTDGLVESRRAGDNEQFGFERVEAAIRSGPRDSASDLCKSIREALWTFQQGRPPEDDLTIVVVRRTVGA